MEADKEERQEVAAAAAAETTHETTEMDTNGDADKANADAHEANGDAGKVDGETAPTATSSEVEDKFATLRQDIVSLAGICASAMTGNPHTHTQQFLNKLESVQRQFEERVSTYEETMVSLPYQGSLAFAKLEHEAQQAVAELFDQQVEMARQNNIEIAGGQAQNSAAPATAPMATDQHA